MAMNGAALGQARKTALDNQAPRAPGETMDAYRLRLMVAESQAIIDYIRNNAVVTVASVTAVQPGAGTSGPGTGTLS